MRMAQMARAARTLLAVLLVPAAAWCAEPADRIVLGPLPSDKDLTPTPAPPSEPFEAAGFAVKESSWDSRPVRVSRFACPYPGAHNPLLQAYRERYGFPKQIEKGKTEFEKLLLLRDWVHQKIQRGREDSSEQDPFVILETAAQGRKYVCTQYSVTMQATAVACGWPAWNTEIDLDHTDQERSHAHSVNEIWCNELGKWVAFDSMNDAHFEKDGVPLNAAELSREWVADQGAHVGVFQGPERKKVAGVRVRILGGKNDAAGYFWSKRIWSWDPFRSFGTAEPDMQVAFLTDAHEGKQWYQGRPPDTYRVHAQLRGALHYTHREADVYPDIGTCSLKLSASEKPGSVEVRVSTFTPGFDALLVSTDGGDYAPATPAADQFVKPGRYLRFQWTLHEGENTLSVRTRNDFGILGKPAKVRVVLEKK